MTYVPLTENHEYDLTQDKKESLDHENSYTVNDGNTPKDHVPQNETDSAENRFTYNAAVYHGMDNGKENEFSTADEQNEEYKSVALNAQNGEDGGSEPRIEQPLSTAKKFLKYRLISGLFFMLSYLSLTAFAVTSCVLKYVFENLLIPKLLVPSALLAVFLPYVLYCAIASTASLLKEINNKNDF